MYIIYLKFNMFLKGDVNIVAHIEIKEVHVLKFWLLGVEETDAGDHDTRLEYAAVS